MNEPNRKPDPEPPTPILAVVPEPEIDPAQRSFTSSDKHELVLGEGKDEQRIPLQPWTPDRIIAAEAMGMRYPWDFGKSDFDQLKQVKNYPGMLKDTIIALWLMTIEDALVDFADAQPREAYKKAKEWAHSIEIDNPRSDKVYDAKITFLKVVVFEVKAAGGPEFIETEDDSGND